ncbi:MAG: M20/M25/M40 family metallo-hydrolase [Bacteroidota bacterium]|nr:M20/M25/M40 family metallo-hydrolase [Bacteroidota bacterium]
MEIKLNQEEEIHIIDYSKDELYQEALNLLNELIPIESFNKQENKSADALSEFFSRKKISHQRKANNLWAFNKHFNPLLPTILLSAHHDRGRPAFGWSINPFLPLIENGKLYGLGSNNVGAGLVSLIATFIYFNERDDLKYNFVFAATEEVENSGNNGLKLLLPKLGEIDFAIIGEPTKMQLIIAEKEVMVIDCISKSGFSPANGRENAIYMALKDIEWFKNYKSSPTQEFSMPITMLLTQIETINGESKNPDKCKFTVDIKSAGKYDNSELLNIIKQNTNSEIKVRPARLKSALIDNSHPFVNANSESGEIILSSHSIAADALVDVPSFIIGPGDPARLNTSDEFIYLHEINEGIRMYIDMLIKVVL